jgi:hypothetical protein
MSLKRDYEYLATDVGVMHTGKYGAEFYVAIGSGSHPLSVCADMSMELESYDKKARTLKGSSILSLFDTSEATQEELAILRDIEYAFVNTISQVMTEARDCVKKFRYEILQDIYDQHGIALNEANYIAPSPNVNKVYLMQHKNGLVKIGRSTNPRAREKTLQADDPDLELLMYFPAEIRVEKRLHEIFADCRVRGEWFKLEPRHIDWLNFLKPRKVRCRHLHANRPMACNSKSMKVVRCESI